MSKEGKDTKTIMIFGLLILVLCLLLFGVIAFAVRAFDFDFGLPNASEPDDTDTENQKSIPVEEVIQPEVRIVNEQIDYNFSINYGESTTTNTTQTSASYLPTDSLSKIQIPVIKVDAPIIQGSDGEKAVDNGWWLYPNSRTDGEKIFLAHRRYFGRYHPFSAWYLDQVPIGEIVVIVDKDGKQYNYKIIHQAIRPGNDLTIFKPSTDDLVKIITCSTWTGDAGSSEYRYITIAERVK